MKKVFLEFRAVYTLTIVIVCNFSIFSQYPVTQVEFTAENETNFNSLPLSNDRVYPKVLQNHFRNHLA